MISANNNKHINSLLDMAMVTQVSEIPGEQNTICLSGPPGMGKTHRVEGWAKSHNLFVDKLIISRIPSVDIGGVYAPDFEKNELKHMITKRLIGGNTPPGYAGKLMLFDEIHGAADDQAVCLVDLLESRMLEGHPVPSNVIFAATMNRAEDNCGGGEMLESLKDRLRIIEVVADVAEWRDWAVDNGIVPEIIAYVSFAEEMLHKFDPTSNDPAHPNPRSWTKLSAMLKQNDSPEMLQLLAKTGIGEAAGFAFSGFCKLKGTLPTLADIRANPETAIVPVGSAQSCYAVLSNIAYDFARMKKEAIPLTKERVESTITYLERFEDVFSVFGFHIINRANDDFANHSEMYSQFVVEHQHLNI